MHVIDVRIAGVPTFSDAPSGGLILAGFVTKILPLSQNKCCISTAQVSKEVDTHA